jgi:capsule polysaccharide export protein KpsE/RkpR
MLREEEWYSRTSQQHYIVGVYFKCALNLTLLDEKVDVQHFINERSINLRFKVLG